MARARCRPRRGRSRRMRERRCTQAEAHARRAKRNRSAGARRHAGAGADLAHRRLLLREPDAGLARAPRRVGRGRRLAGARHARRRRYVDARERARDVRPGHGALRRQAARLARRQRYSRREHHALDRRRRDDVEPAAAARGPGHSRDVHRRTARLGAVTRERLHRASDGLRAQTDAGHAHGRRRRDLDGKHRRACDVRSGRMVAATHGPRCTTRVGAY